MTDDAERARAEAGSAGRHRASSARFDDDRLARLDATRRHERLSAGLCELRSTAPRLRHVPAGDSVLHVPRRPRLAASRGAPSARRGRTSPGRRPRNHRQAESQPGSATSASSDSLPALHACVVDRQRGACDRHAGNAEGNERESPRFRSPRRRPSRREWQSRSSPARHAMPRDRRFARQRQEHGRAARQSAKRSADRARCPAACPRYDGCKPNSTVFWMPASDASCRRWQHSRTSSLNIRPRRAARGCARRPARRSPAHDAPLRRASALNARCRRRCASCSATGSAAACARAALASLTSRCARARSPSATFTRDSASVAWRARSRAACCTWSSAPLYELSAWEAIEYEVPTFSRSLGTFSERPSRTPRTPRPPRCRRGSAR